jgi:hypothetical protein
VYEIPLAYTTGLSQHRSHVVLGKYGLHLSNSTTQPRQVLRLCITDRHLVPLGRTLALIVGSMLPRRRTWNPLVLIVTGGADDSERRPAARFSRDNCSHNRFNELGMPPVGFEPTPNGL